MPEKHRPQNQCNRDQAEPDQGEPSSLRQSSNESEDQFHAYGYGRLNAKDDKTLTPFLPYRYKD